VAETRSQSKSASRDTASAKKMYGKYKAVIVTKQTVPPFNIGRQRTEYVGTRYYVTQDGRDLRVATGAPLYDTREEAVRVAQALIDYRAKVSEQRRAAYEARHV
jgi:hypothetical protein